MYHNGLSLVHLLYVLCSFISPIRFILFFSIIIMLPLYTWEFVMIYGNGIPILKSTEFMSKYGGYFDWKLKVPVLEQMLYFVILTCFFIMISCFKLVF